MKRTGQREREREPRCSSQKPAQFRGLPVCIAFDARYADSAFVAYTAINFLLKIKHYKHVFFCAGPEEPQRLVSPAGVLYGIFNLMDLWHRINFLTDPEHHSDFRDIRDELVEFGTLFRNLREIRNEYNRKRSKGNITIPKIDNFLKKYSKKLNTSSLIVTFNIGFEWYRDLIKKKVPSRLAHDKEILAIARRFDEWLDNYTPANFFQSLEGIDLEVGLTWEHCDVFRSSSNPDNPYSNLQDPHEKEANSTLRDSLRRCVVENQGQVVIMMPFRLWQEYLLAPALHGQPKKSGPEMLLFDLFRPDIPLTFWRFCSASVCKELRRATSHETEKPDKYATSASGTDFRPNLQAPADDQEAAAQTVTFDQVTLDADAIHPGILASANDCFAPFLGWPFNELFNQSKAVELRFMAAFPQSDMAEAMLKTLHDLHRWAREHYDPPQRTAFTAPEEDFSLAPANLSDSARPVSSGLGTTFCALYKPESRDNQTSSHHDQNDDDDDDSITP